MRRLAVEHFNQGASNPAWPTLSSIIDACLSQADESLSHSSGLGILPSPRPMTLHLHKSHAAIFHTLAHKHKHTPTNSQIHKVHTCWLALWWAWLIQFLMLSAKKPPQKTSFVSYLEEPSSFELWIQIHKGYTVHDNSTQQLQPYNTQWLKTICSKSHGLHRTCVAFPERQPCFALKLNNRITMHR